jgi:hypothetical protein
MMITNLILLFNRYANKLAYRKMLSLQSIKENLKKSQTLIDLFNEYEINLEELDFIPVRFAKLPVSARTQHGIITISNNFKNDIGKTESYLSHEICHWIQQTSGNGPTKGSNTDDYLSNPFEQEAFQNQTKYITEKKGPDAAEKYIEKVLDHHDVPEEERSDRKDDLLRTSSDQLKFKYEQEPTGKEIVDNFLDKLNKNEIDVRPRHIHYTKIPEYEKDFRLLKLKEILKELNKKAGILPTLTEVPIDIVLNHLYSITASKVVENIKEQLHLIQDHQKNIDLKDVEKKLEYLQECKLKISNFFFEDGGVLNLLDKRLPPYLQIKLEVKALEDDKYYLNVDGKIYKSVSADDAERILWQESHGFLTFLLKKYDYYIEQLTDIKSSLDNKEFKEYLVELHRLLQECKKYKITKVKDVEKFKVGDFKFVFGPHYDQVKAPLVTDPETASATMDKKNKIIYFIKDVSDIVTVDQFKSCLIRLKNLLEHELKHFQGFKYEPRGGGPAQYARNKELYKEDAEDKFSYHLLDLEFYPLLQEYTNQFKQHWKNAPIDVQKEAFLYFVGAKNDKSDDKIYGRHFTLSAFFNDLKKYNPDKWKIASKEAYKDIFG